MSIRLKRVYEFAAEEDGYRILVDRLWPRGLSKEHAKVDLWLKEIAPSTELRKWFDHDPEKWDEFRERYSQELDSQPATVNQLTDLIQQRHATLLYAAKNEAMNQAVALRQYLCRMLKEAT